MSEFDFFGIEDDENVDQKSPNELEVDFNFDYSNILNDGNTKTVKLCASVKPSDSLRKEFDSQGTIQSAHICLMIDTSESMYRIVDNTGVKYTGQTRIGEDGKKINIVTGGITKLNIAKESAKKAVALLRENDTLSCITYDDTATLLFSNLTINDKETIIEKINGINHLGKSTNISDALLLADQIMSEYTDLIPKRILFFTDGEPTGDDTEEKGVVAGKKLAEHDIAIECMGFGRNDVNFPYLQKISSSSGGITSLIEYPDQFAGVFSSLFSQSQSIVITNVKLVLKQMAGSKIHDYYRGTPDNVYLGDVSESDEKILNINLGQIEKNQMYKYYFNMTVPGQEGEYEGPVNTLNAELHFFVPSKDDKERVIKKPVTINVTSDEAIARRINGEINVLFRLAEVKRFDEEREKAFNSGNNEETVKWIKRIIDVYTELQKPVETKAYTEMLDQYMKTNSISKAVLNKATSSSSQAQETGILDDLGEEEMSMFSSRLRKRRKQ